MICFKKKKRGRSFFPEDWKHGSVWLMKSGKADERSILSEWPIPRPRQWVKYVNEPQSESELAAVRWSVARGTPFRSEGWATQTAARLRPGHTLRPRGRPNNQK